MSGAFSQNIVEEFPLGPCYVTFNGNNLGHTDESTKMTLTAEVVKAMAAKFGKTAVGAYLNGQQAEVDLVLMQNDMTILAAAFPGATQVTNGGGASKITFGKIAGRVITSGTLVLVPENGTNNPASLNVGWTMQAAPIGNFEAIYDGGKIAGFKCKFLGIINESGASDGSYTGTFGDQTITGSSSHPTVSGVVPANAATGVALGSNIVATISAALYGPSVNTQTVTLVQDPLGTPVQITGTVALANNGASTTITFTPTSNLTVSKSYVFALSPLITDQNFNTLGAGGAGFGSHFAT